MKLRKKIWFVIIILFILIMTFLLLSKKDNNKEDMVLLRDVEYNNQKITLIQKKQEMVGKTELIIEDENNKKTIGEFYKNNEIPVEIIDVFIFETKKDEYIIAITESYINVNNEVVSNDGFLKDIYIYNSDNKQVFGLEEDLYEINFNNKDIILKKLKELEKADKL